MLMRACAVCTAPAGLPLAPALAAGNTGGGASWKDGHLRPSGNLEVLKVCDYYSFATFVEGICFRTIWQMIPA